MKLLYEIDKKNYDLNDTICVRPSVRGIIIKDRKIYLIYSQKYHYYKFPGGGIEANENHYQALQREVNEESGLTVIPSSIQEYGYIHRIQKGIIEAVFIQDNYYYLCQVEDGITTQHLDDYEADEGYCLRLVDPLVAIKENKQNTIEGNLQIVIERENKVLQTLIDEAYFK